MSQIWGGKNPFRVEVDDREWRWSGRRSATCSSSTVAKNGHTNIHTDTHIHICDDRFRQKISNVTNAEGLFVCSFGHKDKLFLNIHWWWVQDSLPHYLTIKNIIIHIDHRLSASKDFVGKVSEKITTEWKVMRFNFWGRFRPHLRSFALFNMLNSI